MRVERTCAGKGKGKDKDKDKDKHKHKDKHKDQRDASLKKCVAGSEMPWSNGVFCFSRPHRPYPCWTMPLHGENENMV